MFLADDRRTASAWLVVAGVQDDWDRFYDFLIRVGWISGKPATAVLGLLVQKSAPGFGHRILLGMDDSPTARYGWHVEGAACLCVARRQGVHHNPTPAPADGQWLYGHNWVALAWLARPACGSHADRRRSISREMLQNQFLAALPHPHRPQIPDTPRNPARPRHLIV